MKIEVGKTYEVTGGSGFRKKEDRITIKSINGPEVKIEIENGELIATTKSILAMDGLKLVDEPTKPAHYDTTIDTIAFAKANFTPEQVEGFMRINAIKYLQRYDKKNGAEDICKAIAYLNMLLEHVEGKKG